MRQPTDGANPPMPRHPRRVPETTPSAAAQRIINAVEEYARSGDPAVSEKVRDVVHRLEQEGAPAGGLEPVLTPILKQELRQRAIDLRCISQAAWKLFERSLYAALYAPPETRASWAELVADHGIGQAALQRRVAAGEGLPPGTRYPTPRQPRPGSQSKKAKRKKSPGSPSRPDGQSGEPGLGN